MRHPLPTLVLLLTSALLLAACSREPAALSPSQESVLANPLTADRYFKDLVTTMVDLEINEQAALAQNGLTRTVIRAKERALERAKLAEAQKRQGLLGVFVPVKEDPFGQALLTGTRLYLGTDFATPPGPNLRVYLSTVVDPRDAAFPDPTAVDLGPLQSAYGAQEYRFTTTRDLKEFRTVALYDTALKRIYGFAQLTAQ